MTKIANPHDALFKRSLQEKKIMQQWLKAHLSPATLGYLDLETLTLAPNEHLPKINRKLFSDIVYRCDIKGKSGYIVVAAEHQSTADKNLAFRVLRYSLELMDNHLKQGYKKLPIVLPIVLYSGSRSPYPHTMDIFDCFENPELARELALKNAQLIDLTTMPDEQIERAGVAAAMELLLKHYRLQSGIEYVKRLAIALATTARIVGVEYTLEAVRYLLEVCEDNSNPQELDGKLNVLIEHMPQMEEKLMTLARQLEQRGRQEGRQERAQEIARNLLAANASRELVKQATGLSDAEIARLAK